MDASEEWIIEQRVLENVYRLGKSAWPETLIQSNSKLNFEIKISNLVRQANKILKDYEKVTPNFLGMSPESQEIILNTNMREILCNDLGPLSTRYCPF